MERNSCAIMCSKCGEVFEGRFIGLERHYCSKCRRISLDYAVPSPNCAIDKIMEEWNYIWCHGREENGIEWYIKARDKLIKKFDELHQKQLDKQKLANKIIKERINKWKN